MSRKLIPVKTKFVAGKVIEINKDPKSSKFTLPNGTKKYMTSTEFYIQEGKDVKTVRLPERDVGYLERNLLNREVKYEYIKSIVTNPDRDLGAELEKIEDPIKQQAMLNSNLHHSWRYHIKTIDQGERFDKEYSINL